MHRVPKPGDAVYAQIGTFARAKDGTLILDVDGGRRETPEPGEPERRECLPAPGRQTREIGVRARLFFGAGEIAGEFKKKYSP
jgi:hypothetical protein